MTKTLEILSIGELPFGERSVFVYPILSYAMKNTHRLLATTISGLSYTLSSLRWDLCFNRGAPATTKSPQPNLGPVVSPTTPLPAIAPAFAKFVSR